MAPPEAGRSLRLNPRRVGQSNPKPVENEKDTDVDGKKRTFFSRAAISRVALLAFMFVVMGVASKVVSPSISSSASLRASSEGTAAVKSNAAEERTESPSEGASTGDSEEPRSTGEELGGEPAEDAGGEENNEGEGEKASEEETSVSAPAGEEEETEADADTESAEDKTASSSEITFPLAECSDYEKQVVSQMYDKAETACQERDWLEKHYWEHVIGPTSTRERDTFLVIVVGCNKGFDAIETARLGSADAAYNTEEWRDALKVAIDGGYSIACDKNGTEQVDLQRGGDKLNPPKKSWEAHCIEPMNTTINALEAASKALKLAEHGFVVTKAAIGPSDGEALFPKSTNFGDEDPSFYNCADGGTHDPEEKCETVPTYQLDSYVNQFVTTDKEAPVDMLLIDAEGYDMDVMGYGAETLKRTTFLEFENHGVGKWLEYPLRDVLDELEAPASEGGLGFVCYFVGRRNRIIRVTGCWHEILGRPQWSNLACVRPGRDLELAIRMEETYQAFYREIEAQFRRNENLVRLPEGEEEK